MGNQKQRQKTKQGRNQELEILKNLPQKLVRPLKETPVVGPDGMAYLLVETVEGEGESVGKILSWLGEKGVGLVVNPSKDPPDCVLSYGMVWNFLVHGEFISSQKSYNPQTEGLSDHGEIQWSLGQKIQAGSPSESYWPPGVRSIFKEFLGQQGVNSPKILLLSVDGENYDLCFSLESLKNPPDQEQPGILETFSWFFPRHYSLSLLSEKSIKGTSFIPV